VDRGPAIRGAGPAIAVGDRTPKGNLRRLDSRRNHSS
jgi:hypothetical protein